MDDSRLPPLDPVVEAYKRDVDRPLLRERLKRTPTERIEDLAALARFAQEAGVGEAAPGTAVTDFGALIQTLVDARP